MTGIPIVSLWTPVLYTNALSILPSLALALLSGEFDRLDAMHFHGAHGHRHLRVTCFWLLMSCFIGTAISWAGFWCQSLVSATTYTVVGVMNKMLTISLNVLIWDKHASGAGMASLSLCLVGGTLYQQAPLRVNPSAPRELPTEEEDELVDEESLGEPSQVKY